MVLILDKPRGNDGISQILKFASGNGDVFADGVVALCKGVILQKAGRRQIDQDAAVIFVLFSGNRASFDPHIRGTEQMKRFLILSCEGNGNAGNKNILAVCRGENNSVCCRHVDHRRSVCCDRSVLHTFVTLDSVCFL